MNIQGFGIPLKVEIRVSGSDYILKIKTHSDESCQQDWYREFTFDADTLAELRDMIVALIGA